MTKDLPYALAPDGEVIQIQRLEVEPGYLPSQTACPLCCMVGMCRDSSEYEKVAKMLGHDCAEFDDDEHVAFWRKI